MLLRDAELIAIQWDPERGARLIAQADAAKVEQARRAACRPRSDISAQAEQEITRNRYERQPQPESCRAGELRSAARAYLAQVIEAH